MKKVLFLAVLFTAISGFSQTITSTAVGNLKSTPTHATTDTITNAVTKNQIGIVNGYNEIVTV